MEDLQEDVLKLLFSFVAGAIIGLEREYRSKSAGLRTMILISVGSTLFTLVSIQIGGDPSRIAANVVTGIGFLGGGIIFREEDRVVGTTTAATIWVTAAMGTCLGAGYYMITIIAFAVLIFSLVVMLSFEKRFITYRNQTRSYRIVTRYQPKMLNEYDELFNEFGLNAKRGKHTRTEDLISGIWELTGSKKEHENLTRRLLHDSDIIELDF
jgi:putative Mg2+ transporter-C (MgtC) family protein